jgi:hypothetical protein
MNEKSNPEEESSVIDEELKEVLEIIEEIERVVEFVEEIEPMPLLPEVQKMLVKDVDKSINEFLKQGSELSKKLEKVRKEFEKVKLIKVLEPVQKPENLAGVDGANTTPKFLMGAYIAGVSAMFYPSSKEIQPKGAGKTLIIPPIDRRAAVRYTEEYRMLFELKVALEGINQGKVEILFFDGSLTPLKWLRYSTLAADETAQLKPSFFSLYTKAFKGSESYHYQLLDQNKTIVVGIPKRSVSKVLIRRYVAGFDIPPLWFTDRQICSLLLKAGEYIDPIPYSELLSSSAQSLVTRGLKDNDSPSIWSAEVMVTYFKPSSYAPAVRVEFLKKNVKDLPKILTAVQFTFNMEKGTVHVVHMADLYSKGIWATPDYVWDVLRSETLKKAKKKENLLNFLEYGFKEVE